MQTTSKDIPISEHTTEKLRSEVHIVKVVAHVIPVRLDLTIGDLHVGGDRGLFRPALVRTDEGTSHT
jgi:hypothetical protein